MSNLIFPSLAGLDIAFKRTPFWATAIQTGASGKEQRALFQSSPRWRYVAPLNFLRVTGFSSNTLSNEMAVLNALFHAVKGQWDSFLFTDPYSNTAALTGFGTGTGAQYAFQLLDIEGFPIYDLNGAPLVYVNGVLKNLGSDYTISASGLVTFSAAPGNGILVTWSGGYYRRVRFEMDDFEMEQIVTLCWGNASIKIVSVK